MQKLKKFPPFKSDEDAENFVATADLSEYDFSDFKPIHYEFEKKDTPLYIRVPEALANKIKTRAKKRGMPYTRYIRSLLEADVNKAA